MVGMDYSEIFVYRYYREEDDVVLAVYGQYEEYDSVRDVFKFLVLFFYIVVRQERQVDD